MKYNNTCVRVIVNADDLGMDARTNELVLELMGENRITSATIMANGNACEEAVAMQKIFPDCSFGVHLNLTSGIPLSQNKGLLTRILETKGKFAGLDSLVSARKSMNLLNAIYQELSLQIEKLLLLGLNISHIDSHQHVHNLPSIFWVVKKLQKKYSIRKIRLSKNLYLPGDVNMLRDAKKKVFNFALRNMYSSASADLFTSFETFHQVGVNKRVECQSGEVMVHLRDDCPGWSDYLMLKSQWERDLSFPVKFISYHQIV